jgi:hypothetical protein
MGKWTDAIVAMATAIVGVAIIAVIVSKRSNTADVIKAAGSAYGDILRVAVSPITN